MIRFGLFVLIFSMLPCAAAVLAALRGSSRLAVLWEPMKADPQFSVIMALQPVLASLIVAALLAASSYLVWPRGIRWMWLRIARLLLVFVAVGIVLYPAFGTLAPGLGGLPVWTVFTLLGIAVAASFAFPAARADAKELAYIATVVALFFLNPIGATGGSSIRELAGREFTQQDVVIIGFDSVSHSDVETVLLDYQQSTGGKFIFSNASTPMASTNTSWRTIMSGLYPPRATLPGDLWGRERRSWLPDELKPTGYSVTLLQDDPTTNVFSHEENIEIATLQGWKWMMQTFFWRTLFPLSEVAGTWWLKVAGAPVHFSLRFSYRAIAFQEEVLRTIAAKARQGPILFAAHSCFAHPPIRLGWDDIESTDGWWNWSLSDFEGGGSYFTGGDTSNFRRVAAIRARSMREGIKSTLARLEEAGVLGNAIVFVVSDHGQRAAWISPRSAHHVILTAFVPGPQTTRVVPSPVSLIDIAPTIRSLLQLPTSYSDGVVLPFNSSGDESRVTKQITPAAVSAGAKALMNPRNMGFLGNITYRRDGTFELSPKLRREIEAVIESESRALRALQYMTNKPGSNSGGTHFAN